jgi:4-alpha-glucanotransferase
MDAPEDFRVAGTLIPVFSLRSRRSFGVGDFGDLRMMVDWVATSGQRLLQILPINDTTSSHTWGDSYPYSCISVFALHPQYVELSALPKLKRLPTANASRPCAWNSMPCHKWITSA